MIVERHERNAVLFSLFAGVLLLSAAIAMAIVSSSQAMIMDALYDAVDLIVVAMTLFLIRLYHRPISEKKPFGFSQLESFFLLVKTFMLLALNISVMTNAAILIAKGGREPDLAIVSLFQFLLFAGNFLTWFWLRKKNQRLHSPTVQVEVLAWKFDMLYSLGLSAAFLAVYFLRGTVIQGILPYFDPLVVLVSSALMLPDLFRVFRENITNVLLFAPDSELVEKIKSVVRESLASSDLQITQYDIIRTGRALWVSVYFRTECGSVRLQSLKEWTQICFLRLREVAGKIYVELVPDVGNNEIAALQVESAGDPQRQ